MSDYVVCPECGEKISAQNIKISNTYFFGYIKCPGCGENLTAFHGESIAFLKASWVVKLLWMLSAVVLTVISLCTEYINAWHFKEGVLLCAIVVFMILDIIFHIIHVHSCKKRMKSARNGLLPFIYGADRKKFITFAKETSISECENDEINKYHAEVRLKEYDNSFEKAANVVIMLPRTDMTVKMSAAAENLDCINLYDIYRVNNKDIFVQLSNYTVNENNDISLEFKRVNYSREHSGGFELFTLEGGYIGKVVTEK